MQTMLQEKLNNLLQQKFEQLKAIPEGVDFNPSSAWQKMEDCLHSKNKTYKNKTYKISGYVVAASVVVILWSVWLVKDGKRMYHKNVTSHEAVSGKTQKTLSTVILKKDFVSEVLLKKQPHATTITNEVALTKDKKPAYSVATIENAEQLKTPLAPALKESITLIIQPETTVATPPGKKLRIIHNNEIKQSVETAQRNTTASTRLQILRLFPLTSIDIEEPLQEATTSPAINNKRFIKAIIKIHKED